MTFLNALLLFGALAAAVPLIIHLLHRTKTKVIHWAAMHFLSGAVQRKSRRLQWQQWLLLALRCAIPALLAMAMAQPALTWLGARFSDRFAGQPLILMDSSLSTLAPLEQPISPDEPLASSVNVKEIAAKISESIASPQILQYQDANEHSGREQSAKTQWQASRDSTAAAIANRFASTQRPFIEELTSAIDQFNAPTDDAAPPTLVVVSDFRQALLSQITADQRQRIRSLLSSSPTAPQLVLMPLVPLGEIAQSRTNVAVHIDASSDAVVGPKQTGRVDFTIGNFGNDAANDVVIDLQLDGQTRGTFRTTLAPGQIERRSVWLPPLAIGDHACQIVVDRTDSFTLDNRAAWVVQSIAPQKVLLISGSDRNSSADFMHFAIEPPELGNEEAMANETVLPRQFEVVGPVMQHERGQIESWLTKGVQHVVLCNVARIDDDIFGKVMAATGSGSLILLAGKNLDANWFKQLQSKYNSALPFEIATGSRVNKNNQTLKFAQSANSATGRQMIDAVSGSESTITLQQAWNLKVQKQEANPSDPKQKEQQASDILAVDGEDQPILVLKRNDNRTVLVSACDFYPDDTSLPVTDAFLPLVQGFYQSFIAAEYDHRNIACGDRLPDIRISEQAANDAQSTKWRAGLKLPSPKEQNTAPKQAMTANSPMADHTPLPGYFSAGENDAKPHLAASQMPWADSDLTIPDMTTVKTFASDLGAKLWTADKGVARDNLPTSDANEKEVAAAKPRFVIWRYVLFALLVALFAEILLQRHLTRSFAG